MADPKQNNPQNPRRNEQPGRHDIERESGGNARERRDQQQPGTKMEEEEE